MDTGTVGFFDGLIIACPIILVPLMIVALFVFFIFVLVHIRWEQIRKSWWISRVSTKKGNEQKSAIKESDHP